MQRKSLGSLAALAHEGLKIAHPTQSDTVHCIYIYVDITRKSCKQEQAIHINQRETNTCRIYTPSTELKVNGFTQVLDLLGQEATGKRPR